MKKKNVTIDQLAVMVQNGFSDVSSKMATKVELQKGLEGVNKRLDKVDNRLDRIEDILLEKHDEEIKSLKARVRILENALGIE